MLVNVRHLVGAFRYSLAGLKRGWGEQAFRHEAIVLVLMFPLLVFIGPGAAWTSGLIAAWLGVMALELLNSAVEEMCDLVSPEYNIHVKYAKDLASAAIFVGIVANAVLWIAMLWARYFAA